MARILLANFLVTGLPLLLLVAGIILVGKARTNVMRHAGFALASIPVGVFAYIVSGISAANLRGEGHFYSVPFGGYRLSDNSLVGFSILVWISLVFAALSRIFRRKP